MTSETPVSGNDQPQTLAGQATPSPIGNVALRTLLSAVVGIVGAILSWKAIERIGDVFVLPDDLAGLAFGQVPSPEDQARLAAATLSLNIRNAAIWQGTAGAVLGTLFGMTICLSRRSGGSCIRMILSTVVAGTLFGALAGAACVWINTIARQNMAPGATSPAEAITLLMHSANWLILGLGIGLGIALGGPRSVRPRMESMIVIGLVGMVGGCLFPVVAGLLFPAVNSTWPIPASEPAAGQILWLSLPSVLMGLVIGRNG